MTKKNVIIAGTLPPPIGGVTVHIKRLKLLLDSTDYNGTFVNLRPRTSSGGFNTKIYVKNLLQCMKLSKNSILHYQLNNWIEASFLALFCRVTRTRMIFTVHSFRPKEFSTAKWIFFNFGRKFINMFIAPSLSIKTELLQYKVRDSKITVIDTYLPPSKSELNEVLPQDLIEFVDKSEKVVVANAYKLYLDESNTDVYGLDMCIEACARIPEISFVFCVPIIGNREYMDKCLNKIKERNIEEKFLIFNKNISLVSLFKYADMFVRPTSTDSFGVSVAEAISCGVPAIASDVCDRAEGAIIFKSRNINDFEDKIKQCIDEGKKRFENNNQKSDISKYLDLYDTVIDFKN